MDMERIIDFAKKRHDGQLRIGGEPYIIHPVAVMDLLISKGITDKDYVATAILHDTLEDTDASEDDILLLTNRDVLSAVILLTKKEGYDMDNYIKGIEGNKIAKIVKLADRLHNLQSAKVAYRSFKKKYIKETKDYYLHLSKGSIFEDDIKRALYDLVESL